MNTTQQSTPSAGPDSSRPSAAALPADPRRRLVLRSQDPIGKQVAMAMVCGPRDGGLKQVEEDVFPTGPDAVWLRTTRVEAERGLRETAAALGLSPPELTALELGKLTCAGPEEWTELRRRLQAFVDGRSA